MHFDKSNSFFNSSVCTCIQLSFKLKAKEVLELVIRMTDEEEKEIFGLLDAVLKQNLTAALLIHEAFLMRQLYRDVILTLSSHEELLCVFEDLIQQRIRFQKNVNQVIISDFLPAIEKHITKL